jgi:hypothetical protein
LVVREASSKKHPEGRTAFPELRTGRKRVPDVWRACIITWTEGKAQLL